jgi:hypothetical protein
MLLYLDGFDRPNSGTDLSARYNVASTPGVASYPSGRTGSALGLGNFASLSCTVGRTSAFANTATFVIGLALHFNAFGPCGFLYVTDAGSEQVSLWVDSSGHVLVKQGATTLYTSAATLEAGVWNYVELKATIHPSAGSVTLHIGGALDGSVSSVNTRGTSNSYINGFVVSNNNASIGVFGLSIDDLYILDTTGAVNNDFVGCVRIETLVPTGAGATTNFTPNGAGTNYGCVNEGAWDDDTTYVADATPGDIDTYAATDLSSSGLTIYGLQITHRSRKDDVTTRAIATCLRSGGTNYFGTTIPLTQTWTPYFEIHETDPHTSAQWTGANVNAMEIGVKVIT